MANIQDKPAVAVQKAKTSKELLELILLFIQHQDLLMLVFSQKSKSREGSDPQKIKIQPFLWKSKPAYQSTRYIDKKVVHSNYYPSQMEQVICEIFSQAFGQITIQTSKEHLVAVRRKEGFLLSSNSLKQSPVPLEHNRKKEHIFPDGKLSPVLCALGIMDDKGQVIPSSRDKFTQINRFLEMIRDVLPLDSLSRLHIADFGCGKAYLSFALYEWLSVHKKMEIYLTGVDFNLELTLANQVLADQLSYTGMSFVHGEIVSYDTKELDMALCLHACDTATDDAILQGVKTGCKWIFAAPCCQHELYQQMKTPLLKPLWKHGILKEKFSSLLTDAFRALFLEAMGYKVQIMEFVDSRHSPKNILLRAVKMHDEIQAEKWQDCLKWADELGVKPYILTCRKVYVPVRHFQCDNLGEEEEAEGHNDHTEE
jgi:SAM-dependent methyltransferase